MYSVKENSFFSKLSHFCYNFEKDVNDLTKLQNSHENDIRCHTTAIDNLKSNVSKLKDSSEECKEKIASLESFDAYAQSLEEDVNNHFDELDRMEMFLKQFGYDPPNVELIEKEENTLEVQEEEPNIPVTPNTPVMTPVTKRSLAEKQMAKQCLVVSAPEASNNSQNSHGNVEEETPRKSNSSVEQWLNSCSDPNTFTPASMRNLSINTLENKNICNEEKPSTYVNGSLLSTPKLKLYQTQPQGEGAYSFNCYSSPHTPLQRHCFNVNDKKQHNFENNYFKKNIDRNKFEQTQISTPEEPTMSDFGVNFCKEELEPSSIHTPDDPVLSMIGKNVCSKAFKTSEDIHTPEEPAVNLNPLSSFIGNSAKCYNDSFDILASPVISTVTESLLANLRYTKYTENVDTVESENSIYEKETPVKICRERLIEPPESPQLSDITMQIMNRREY